MTQTSNEQEAMASALDTFEEFAAPAKGASCGCGCSSKSACQCTGNREQEGAEADMPSSTGGESELFDNGFDEEMETLAERLAPLLSELAPIAAEAIASEWELDGEDYESGEEADEIEPDQGGPETDDTTGPPGISDEDEAVSQQLAAAAASAADDHTAECLAGGVVVQIFAPAPVEVKRVLPAILHRTSRLVRLLRRNARTRPLLRLLPHIERRTAAALMRRASRGGRVTRRRAVRILRRQTGRLLGSPRGVVRALRRNSARRRWLNFRAIARSERSA